MVESAKWWSESNGNGSIRGVNDAGIDTFSVSAINSMVREVIQNSLDAEKINSSKPTLVEFKSFSIPEEEFPGVTQFKSILNKCMTCDVNRNDKDINNIFGNALKELNKEVNILRISDFNTCGLLGADTGKRGSIWSRLVKELGTANSNQGAQGSFGIGKSAPFTCSALRTIFYSSLDKNGIKSNIGVARLVSYLENNSDENSLATGELYWSDNAKCLAIQELSNIDKSFIRTQSGTDIFIMGLRQEKNLDKRIIFAVVMNFLVSIWSGKLEVIVNNYKITKKNLKAIIDKFSTEYDEIITNKQSKEDLTNLQNYYTLLNMANKKCHKISIKAIDYGEEFGFDNNEATLLLMEGEELNRRILMTRKAGMKLFEQSGISGSLSFTGILLITGKKMNSEFRKMETASHDKWALSACRDREDEARLTKMYKDLRKYLKDIILKEITPYNEDIIDAFGINDFLPANTNNSSISKIKKEQLLGVVKIKNETNISPKAHNIKTKNTGDESGLIPPRNKRSNTTHKPNKNHPNPPHTLINIKFKPENTPVQQSLVCLSKNTGTYLYQFIAPSSKAEKLDFYLNAEKFDAKLVIDEIKVLNDNIIIINETENSLILSGLKKNSIIKIQLTIPFDQYCKLEVEHYEAQK